MRPATRIWLYLSVGLLLGLMLINGGIAYWQIRQLHEHALWVSHTYQVLEVLESTVSTLTDAETGQRGYVITADPAYLEPYRATLTQFQEKLDQLARLTRDNPDQRERIPRFEELASKRLELLAKNVASVQQGNREAAAQVIVSGEPKRVMDQIHSLAGDMQQDERRLLDEREAEYATIYRGALLNVGVTSLAAITALAAFLWLLRKHAHGLANWAAAIHQQRELLHATLVSIGDGVISTDAHANVTFMNPVAEKLTGWSGDDASGESLENVFRIVNEETRARVENPALRALREGRIVGLANHTILLAKNGREWPIDDSAAPIRGQDGVVSGTILVFREITERKFQESELQRHSLALKESEERFHTLVDSIPQLAWMARPDGHIHWYNQRWYQFTGSTPEQMEGWGWQSVHDPAELPRVLESWKAALASGQQWEETFPLRRHDGVMRWHLSLAVPIRNEQGEIVRWFGTNTDISERLQMEEALRDADRRKDEFLATLAHELRNPIAPISNALQLWPSVENDREQMEELRAMMERQVQQMIRLIDDLMDVSRITRGKIQLRLQSVDLATVVAGAVEAVRPMIESRAHELTINVPDEPLLVQGDVARLTQTLGNLLQNAAKYTGRNGKIAITAWRQGDEALVGVRDNGPGIPRHMLAQIFEMFEQVDQTLDRSFGGLGLGLTLVKRLVELHGGSVEAYSDGPGSGSEFVARLPAIDNARPKRAETRPPGQANLSDGLPRHRILVVDDVVASAKTLAMMLESIGQEVHIAHDGPSAIDRVLVLRPDVVFLDIAMPGMDGYEVARQLRASDQLRDVSLVALTGYGQEEDRRRAIDAGFHHHLIKPTSIDQLARLLFTVPVSVER
jgi:PAS domain S-box-containing protein